MLSFLFINEVKEKNEKSRKQLFSICILDASWDIYGNSVTGGSIKHHNIRIRIFRSGIDLFTFSSITFMGELAADKMGDTEIMKLDDINIFTDLCAAEGMSYTDFNLWLEFYLVNEAVKRDIPIVKFRQTVLADSLMNWSPTFRRDMNNYRKKQIEDSIKLNCTLNEVNKIFDAVMEEKK